MSSEIWNSTDAYCDGQLGPEEDVETVKCDCGHSCHVEEADEERILCGNCRDDLRNASYAEHYPQWLAARKLEKQYKEWEADGKP